MNLALGDLAGPLRYCTLVLAPFRLNGPSCTGEKIKAVTSDFTCTNGPNGQSEPFHYPQTAGTLNMVDAIAIQYYNGGAFIRWNGSNWDFYIKPADRYYVPAVCKIAAY